MKIGWIGLGAMGWPMAGHLHRAGHLDAVYNRTSEKAEGFAEQHADVAVMASPSEMAEAVDVIVLCVSADEDLIGLIESMSDSLRPGQRIVDHSTVSPTTARQLAESLRERDVGFVDAPVTGGVEGAVKGKLAIMGGGQWGDFHAMEPLFEAYSRVHHHLGPSGSGQAAKAVNQLMVAGIAEAVCESLALMEKLDLPREPMLKLLAGGAAGNWFLDKRGRSMLADEFDIGFHPKLLLKDLKICKELCGEAEFDSSVVKLALSDYARLIEEGDKGRDISALIRLKNL